MRYDKASRGGEKNFKISGARRRFRATRRRSPPPDDGVGNKSDQWTGFQTTTNAAIRRAAVVRDDENGDGGTEKVETSGTFKTDHTAAGNDDGAMHEAAAQCLLHSTQFTKCSAFERSVQCTLNAAECCMPALLASCVPAPRGPPTQRRPGHRVFPAARSAANHSRSAGEWTGRQPRRRSARRRPARRDRVEWCFSREKFAALAASKGHVAVTLATRAFRQYRQVVRVRAVGWNLCRA